MLEQTVQDMRERAEQAETEVLTIVRGLSSPTSGTHNQPSATIIITRLPFHRQMVQDMRERAEQAETEANTAQAEARAAAKSLLQVPTVGDIVGR